MELLRRVRERIRGVMYTEGGGEVWEGVSALYFDPDKQTVELILITGGGTKVEGITTLRIEGGVGLDERKTHVISTVWTNLFFRPPVKVERGEFDPKLLIIKPY